MEGSEAYLKHLWNGSVVSLYQLRDGITIGRAPSCHITLDDPTVSSEHALLQPYGTTWVLLDNGSTNGIVVKGEKIERLELEPDAQFSIGTHQFIFLRAIGQDLDKTLKIKKSWIPGVYYTE